MNADRPKRNGGSKQQVIDEVLQRAMKLIAAGKLQKAVDLLNAKAIRDGAHQNVKGVCLLRLGQPEEALRVFRSLVLSPGCTWMRADAPILHKVNFASALLLAGRPSGCLETLGEIHQEEDPRVQQLRAAIKRWVSTLSLWQKLNWWFGRLEPGNRPVVIDFELGDYGVEIPQDDSQQPADTSSQVGASQVGTGG